MSLIGSTDATNVDVTFKEGGPLKVAPVAEPDVGDATCSRPTEAPAPKAGRRASLAIAGKLHVVEEGAGAKRRASLSLGAGGEAEAPAATGGGHARRASLVATITALTGTSAFAGPRLSERSDGTIDEQQREDEEEERLQARKFDPSDVERDELATASAALTFKDVHFTVNVPDLDSDPSGKTRVDKTILDNSWGHIEPGSLVALMGPSGCGKSTLLDILANKKTAKYQGTICMNGHERDSLFQRVTSYVGQMDVMNQFWTVQEAVKFDLLLKKPMPKGAASENLDLFVADLLDDVGLLHVKDTRIGGQMVRGISGGQKRRVTLARGIAGKASIMFCDEPTSGLSATDAELCIQTLVKISRRWNVTILVVIHQPRIEVAELFDHLILLTSRPGRIVYNGPMKDAPAYWEKAGYPVPMGTNPCDHYLDMVTPGAQGAKPDFFVEYYNKHALPKIKELVESKLAVKGKSAMDMLEFERTVWLQFGWLAPIRRSVYGTSWLTQYGAVLKRKLKLTITDAPLLALTFGSKVLVGVMLGLIYMGIGQKEPRGSVQLSMFFMIVQQVALHALVTMPPMFDERLIMKSETSEALYSTWVYACSSCVVDSLMAVVANCMEVVIILAFADMGKWDRLPEVLLWVSLLSVAMESLLIAVCAACKGLQIAQALAVPAMLVPIMYSGYLVNRNSCKEQLGGGGCAFIYMSPMHFVMEKFTSIFYKDDERAWRNIQALYGHEEPEVYVLLAYCVGFAVVFRALHLFNLSKFNNLQK